jgi:anhydro-N-acetylmuramic acid kinase
MGSCCIGLMSGTSLDGVDGVLMDFSPDAPPQVLASAGRPFPADLRDAFLALNTSGHDEFHRGAVAGQRLAHLYADTVHDLLQQSGLSASDIAAIGAHGQTVRHCPPSPETSNPYTLQINQPALLAELTGMRVVADFRSRDLAAGGQGAPLVPAFHREVFGRPGHSQAVVNIGGIANVTALHADGRVQGLDTGPGNVLLDLWCLRHTGQWFDADGRWGQQGTVSPALLAQCLSEPYFALAGVKSTGRDLFNAAWLDRQLAQNPDLSPVDVQATLTRLTASTIASAIQVIDWKSTPPDALWVCGGGALNLGLMAALGEALPGIHVGTTAECGWPVMQVEAAAFAWLAHRALRGLPGNEPQVTGAQGHRVLGAIYPA